MRNRKIRIIAFSILAAGILLWLVPVFFFHPLMNKVIHRAEQRTGLQISYHHSGMKGFSAFYISQLHISGRQGDTLANVDSAYVSLKLLPLMVGQFRFSQFELYHANIFLSSRLFTILSQRRSPDTTSASREDHMDYARLAGRIQSLFFRYLPDKMYIKNSGIIYKHDTLEASATAQTIQLAHKKLTGVIQWADNTMKSNTVIDGLIDKKNHRIHFGMVPKGSSHFIFPYLGIRWHGELGFDTLAFDAGWKSEGDQLSLNGNMNMHGLSLYHERISPDTIGIPSCRFNYLIHIGQRSVEVDSASTVQINSFSFSPYIKFTKDTSVQLTLSIVRKEFEAGDLFGSLPSGLFSNFKGIQTSGRLAFHLFTHIDFGRPDSLTFDASLEDKGFKIIRYGTTDFRMLNGPFVQHIYEHNQLVKSMMVGDENPDFVKLDDISPFLRFSVLTSEDGDFYYHHGFNEDAFRESIVKNIRERRFARGGSTLTMQLVKNVFLSRKKNIARKIEEALIVWIIENQHLVTKDRMFEVYLNIIEWGPGIYGIKPAAAFYFNKTPHNLSLSESIYLAGIIPRPKGFRYTFDKNGAPQPYLTSYYELLSHIMLKRNQISPEDTLNLKPVTSLPGEASKYLAVNDSLLEPDSLFFITPIQAVQGIDVPNIGK